MLGAVFWLFEAPVVEGGSQVQLLQLSAMAPTISLGIQWRNPTIRGAYHQPSPTNLVQRTWDAQASNHY